MSYTLRARWVLPIDRPPIEGGYVAIQDGRIVAIGNKDPSLGAVQDLGDVVLLPGLVNSHTHLEFSSLLHPLGAPGVQLPSWIRMVIADRKRPDRDSQAAILAGLSESLASGVTTIGEIATAPAALYLTPEPVPAAVLFQEAIGFSASRVESVFVDVERRLNCAPLPAGLSPHAPYTVHPWLVEKLVELAASRNVPVAMHLAESPDELRLLASGEGEFRYLLEERSMWDADAIPRGSRPMDYLRILATAPHSLIIHGNYLATDEIRFIAECRDRMSVVYCPRTHEYFDHSPYPLVEMLAGGVRVALGTDSRASNPDLSVLDELRTVMQKFPGVATESVLRMATLSGAEGLGMSEMIGSLTPGKRADVIALSCGPLLKEPYDVLLNGSSKPCQVWLGGQELAL
jgi:cytosine/adenosine deaminase-related metal-dependent hydrolase